MNFKITETKKEDLLFRTVVKAEVLFENAKTPSNAEIKKAIASHMKSDESLVVMKKIAPQFGRSQAEVLAYVYNTKEDIVKVEPKKQEKKAAPGAEAPAAEAKK